MTRSLARAGQTARGQAARLVYVRPPAKGANDERGLAAGVALGVVVALGVLALVWITGHLGYRLGFATAVMVPELDAATGDALSTGVRMLIAVPGAILAAGLLEPIWLLVAMLAVALPAGALPAARPRVRGGPLPNRVFDVLAQVGAAAVLLAAALVVAWTGAGARTALLAPLPADPDALAAWSRGLQAAAGLDVMAGVSAALWTVLAFRLPIARWMRAIAASAALFALVVATTAMAISGGTAAQVATVRSVVVPAAATDGAADADRAPALLLGHTAAARALLVRGDTGHEIVLTPADAELRVVGRASLDTVPWPGTPNAE